MFAVNLINMLSSLVIAALVATSFAASIQQKPPQGRIIGGKDTTIESHPHQVSIKVFGEHNCGGSIISKFYVLTAGHCQTSPFATSVRAGSSIWHKGGSVHQVVKFIRHEEFHRTPTGVPVHDIALIQVKEPFEFDETRQPINLFEQDEETIPGFMSVISGWGDTGFGGLPSQLQTVTVPIISKELCDRSYEEEFGGLSEGQICASYYEEGGRNACLGDSGGPLVIDGRQAGIVSWSEGCARPHYPTVYTEVAHYRNWIREHVQA